MQFVEAKQALATKLDIDYTNIATNGLFSDTDLGTFIQDAVLRSWDYKPWDFAQASKTGNTPTSTLAYYDYPQDVMTGSIYFLRVAGNTYRKLSFQSYLRWFEQNPQSKDYIWAEQNGEMFINQNAYNGGDMLDMYGKKMPPHLANSTDLLPFSPVTDNQEHSGNSAIVQLAYGLALSSEKKKNPQQGALEMKEAYSTLDIIWKPFEDQKTTQQQRNIPYFNVPDMFQPNVPNFTPGNFNLPNQLY